MMVGWSNTVGMALCGENLISILKRGSMIGVLALVSSSSPVKADPMRDFVVSCSYGVLAGTLVGAATLAFSDKPGDNLNRVARGASLGLYAGILLGAYVVFGVPADDEDAAEQLQNVGNENGVVPLVVPMGQKRRQLSFRIQREVPRMQFYPIMGEHGLEGAQGSLRVLSF